MGQLEYRDDLNVLRRCLKAGVKRARVDALCEVIVPASAKDFPGGPRCPVSSLNCRNVHRLLPFPLPAFSAWLRDHAEETI